MEDVWKDISLASLCDHNSPAAGNSATTNDRAALRGFIFQDFLAAASTKLAPASGLAAAPPPTTLLCLSSSGSDQHQIQSTANTSAPVKPNPQRLHGTSSTSSSLISFSANNLSVALDCKKRAVEESGDNSRRVRHRRMIKNRESASRSRARKQERPFCLSHVLLLIYFIDLFLFLPIFLKIDRYFGNYIYAGLYK